MQQFNKHHLAIILSTLFTVSGCASLVNPDADLQSTKVALDTSFLEGKPAQTGETIENNELEQEQSEVVRLNRIDSSNTGLKLGDDLSVRFSTTSDFQISVNELPLNEFLHYVLGDLLKVSYLIEPAVKSNATPVTLELKEKISGKRLFQLTQQILNQNNINVAFNEDVFFIHPIKQQGNKSNIAFGFGRKDANVPNVSGDVTQLVPVRYGISTGLRNTISSLIDAVINVDTAQGLITISGKKEQVLRGLALVRLLDSSAIYDKSVALFSFRYIDSQTFIEKTTELLTEEGIVSSTVVGKSKTLHFIPIEHLGKVAVFATSDEIIDRVEYWAHLLDKPRKGSEQSFYTYQPRYARAADLGESLAPLISSNSSNVKSQTNRNTSSTLTDTANRNRNSAANNNNDTQIIDGENMRLVVDSRSNSLIFYSTGKYYQELQPIIKQLDVMPKQVMLEVVIAEVTLSGSFAKGVEYAISNGPSGSKTENFSFDSKAGFSYSVVGLNGEFSLNLNQTDGLVNVLSRPTLLVRDGVDASISVGDDVPTVGSTTADPNGERETTNIQYRKTGIDLVVTPTVNAQGTVIMTIEQNISNVAPDGLDIGGSPSIFERKVKTEVVAGDGQTVMLGGLISENKSKDATAIPVLGSIPILGHLFRSDSENTSKTELVILVTPKIVHNVNEWQRIQESFTKGLEHISF
ncbi:type II secretion system protein GspD [Colwellia sp. MEBiC06753]